MLLIAGKQLWATLYKLC